MTATEPAGARVELGIVLPPPPDDLGEWLTDAGAFDAAGAATLWLEAGGKFDVLALGAALAVTTFRARLVMHVPDPRHVVVARSLTTIRRLSRERLVLVSDGTTDPAALAPGCGLMRRVPDDPGGYTEPRESGAVLRWRTTELPPGRQAWLAARAEAAEHGVDGLVVPADPGLLDILRNPDDPGSRRDLHLAQG